jgi:sugar phosphate isomerase/epimerase
MSDCIGVSTAALFPMYLTEHALTALAELGFQVFEIMLQSRSEYEPAFIEELNRRRQAAGARVHSVHLNTQHFDFWSGYPRRAEESRLMMQRGIEAAARWEAAALTWHGQWLELGNPRAEAAFFDAIWWAGDRAKAAGLTLTLENVSWAYIRDVEHVEAARRAGLPVGFTFDTFQAWEADADPVALIQAMGDRLTTVHLSDCRANGARHLLPGLGDLDWPGLFAALHQVGYVGPLLIEPAYINGDLTALCRSRDFVSALWADGLN